MNTKQEIKMTFDLPKENPSIIKVIGVGGGGSNAVNHMFRQGIKGVDFMICNTDNQALDSSPIPLKFQLGRSLTEGRGAGSLPEVGRNAAIESIDEIKEELKKNTKMLFVTAGMGGGTGTGAAPVIAAAAKELGILTVGIVTTPFVIEGRRRSQQAEEGIRNLRENVDTLIVISNDKLREMCGSLRLNEAFANADNVLTTAAKGIAEIITVTGYINVDFADVETVMKNGGSAIMGSAIAEGKDRARIAIQSAMSSPLLNDNKISGAKHILINITAGDDQPLLEELAEIVEFAQEESGNSANVIFGTGFDESLGNKICVTLIATGFQQKDSEKDRVYHTFENNKIAKPEQKVDAPAVIEILQPEKMPEPVIETIKDKTRSGQDVEINFKTIRKEGESEINSIDNSLTTSGLSNQPHVEKSKERLDHMRSIMKNRLNSPAHVDDMNKTPAYQRREVTFNPTPASNQEIISKYTISDNPNEAKPEIRPNNNFMHEKLD